MAGCDPNKATLEAFCDDRNIPLRFTSSDELLRSGEVDVIVLLTPPAIRDEYIFPALEKGIHVLVEKPFGCSYAECLRYVKTLSIGRPLSWREEVAYIGNHRLPRDTLIWI